MRLFISGSAPLLAETHSAFEQRTGLVIDAVEGIDESAVFSVPHADFGEAVAVAVVSNQPMLTEKDIFRALQGRHATLFTEAAS